MKKTTHLTLLALAGVLLSASALAAEPPIIRETFTCNFNQGQDMDDLMAARDFYLNQMEKLGMDPRQHFVWTPYKVAVDFDFLWAVNFPDLVTFGRESDRYLASAEGRAAEERFDRVATCSSSLSQRWQVYQGPGEFSGDPGSPGVIGTFACNYRHGHGPDDLGDFMNHAADVVGSVDREDGYVAFAAVPMAGAGPNTRDVYFYGVQGTLEDWAERSVAIQTSEGGASLRRHLDTLFDCSSGLFFAQRVIPKPE